MTGCSTNWRSSKALYLRRVPTSKNAVRDYLRQINQEDRWTELQGYVYGPGMSQAQLYPGVLEFFDRCRSEGVEVFIISHRTRHPFLGEQYDLHEAARALSRRARIRRPGADRFAAGPHLVPRNESRED